MHIYSTVCSFKHILYTFVLYPLNSLVIVYVSHLVVSEASASLVIDLKPCVELQPLQQLQQTMTLYVHIL